MWLNDALTSLPEQDPNVPQKCVITMATINGAGCRTWIQCAMDDHIGIDVSDHWQVCYLGGITAIRYISDPC